MLVVDRLDADHIAGLIGDLIALDALSAALLDGKFIQAGALAHAVFRHDQQAFALAVQLHADDLVPVVQVHADHTHGGASGRSHVRFLKADAHAVLRHQENLRIRVGDLHLDQLVVIPENDGGKTVLSHVAVFHNGRLLHDAVSGHHEQVLIVLIVLHRNDGRDLLSR